MASKSSVGQSGKLPSLKGTEGGGSTNRSNKIGMQSTMSIEQSVYQIDKKKYGALLPKTGVYFLPDERVVAFLK